MQSVIRSGFGCFSYILGPWTDYFPAQLTQPDSQYGVCLGTKIIGGPKGAQISAITIEPPFNIAGNNGAIPWRCLVIKGDIPLDASLRTLQLATNGWPAVGESQQKVDVQWSKMTSAKTTANAYNSSATTEPEVHFTWPEGTGPSCDNGETLTVLFFPMFNDTGVPGYGAANRSYVSLSVYGSYQKGRPGEGGVSSGARSLQRGTIGS